MDMYSALDEKSQKIVERLLDGENLPTRIKPVKKKKIKKDGREKRSKHFEEFHFQSSADLIKQIKSGKKVYRGGEPGWITIDSKDPNMVVSYQRQENGKMGFSYESYEVFKAYMSTLDESKVDGYIDFWHKKPFVKKETSNSDEE